MDEKWSLALSLRKVEKRKCGADRLRGNDDSSPVSLKRKRNWWRWGTGKDGFRNKTNW